VTGPGRRTSPSELVVEFVLLVTVLLLLHLALDGAPAALAVNVAFVGGYLATRGLDLYRAGRRGGVR
jgi:hypothetical protein